MHIYLDQLRDYQPMPRCSTLRVCHLLSDELPALKAFGSQLGMDPGRLRWSRAGVPHYLIGSGQRLRAFLAGGLEVSPREVGLLVRLWRRRELAPLRRLANRPPYPQEFTNRPF
jgi:hypothetical protein